MKYLKTFSLLLSLVGCQSTQNVSDFNYEDNHQQFEREPLLESYFQLFDTIFGTDSNSISSTFADEFGGKDIGYCYHYESGFKKITINPEFWDTATFLERELLIFHELGHCSLNKEHNNSTITVKGYDVPKSIMNSYNFEKFGYYSQYREHYISEMKGE